jgi:hypothetical protein
MTDMMAATHHAVAMAGGFLAALFLLGVLLFLLARR